uniref:Uncharacterized protein n=1 Tax=Percolomonas cosmopolitus TaxID=63605 RepID=A0A7S1KP44_9EUKA
MTPRTLLTLTILALTLTLAASANLHLRGLNSLLFQSNDDIDDRWIGGKHSPSNPRRHDRKGGDDMRPIWVVDADTRGSLGVDSKKWKRNDDDSRSFRQWARNLRQKMMNKVKKQTMVDAAPILAGGDPIVKVDDDEIIRIGSNGSRPKPILLDDDLLADLDDDLADLADDLSADVMDDDDDLFLDFILRPFRKVFQKNDSPTSQLPEGVQNSAELEMQPELLADNEGGQCTRDDDTNSDIRVRC